MRRVSVVGNSGSGKTTFAGQLATRLGIPHVELDAIYWGPNWSHLDNETLQARVRDPASPQAAGQRGTLRCTGGSPPSRVSLPLVSRRGGLAQPPCSSE